MTQSFLHILRMGVLAIAILPICAANARDEAGLTDVQAKLVIVHNFISQYVHWPGRYALDRNRQIYVCGVGQDEVIDNLPLLEKASTSELTVKVLTKPGKYELNLCHVLYIADTERGRYQGILAEVRDYPILTVSNIREFAEAGGMVGLETEVKRAGNFEKHYVRYVLNAQALSDAQLFVEPDALELASRVVHQ